MTPLKAHLASLERRGWTRVRDRDGGWQEIRVDLSMRERRVLDLDDVFLLVQAEPTIADVAAYLEIKAANFYEGEGWTGAALDVRMIADGVFDPRESVNREVRDEAIRRIAAAMDVPLWLLDSTVKAPFWERVKAWFRR